MKSFGTLVLIALLTGILFWSSPIFYSADAKASPKDAEPEKTKVRVEPNPVVVVETSKGVIKMLVYKNEAPTTAQNFLELVKNHTYDGTKFHRYEPKFCVQGGDPTGTGRGGSGKSIPLEINRQLKHSEAGMVGMARGPKRDSASSQFYIILGPQSGLDNEFAVFAKVTEGLDIVFTLRKGDTMDSLYLEGSKKEPKKETKKESKKEG
ncbi:MAG: peptidylprolyl isomerase [Candidatus Melainabacteria bacterium]|nr:peptidylprolyl isomerase [Candidatus Melainabacteria bacterium]